MKENEQMMLFDSENKVAANEGKSPSASKLKVLEKEIEELKRKVEVLYKSLRR